MAADRLLSFWKLKLKFRHAHFSAAELDAFHLQAKALIEAFFAGDGNAPAGRNHAMPGKPMRLAEHPYHQSRALGKSGRATDGAVT